MAATPSPPHTPRSNMNSLSLPSPPLPLRPGPRLRPAAVSAAAAAGGGYPTLPLSISDEALAARGFAIHRTAAGLDLDALNGVFAAVGFPRREPGRIRVALEHTAAVVWAAARRSPAAPVAFARATGDGVFNAVIWDVVVDPGYQGIGLGKAMVERIVSDLVRTGVTNIALYSEPRVLGFYRPLGFAVDPDGIRGMVYSRKSKNGN